MEFASLCHRWAEAAPEHSQICLTAFLAQTFPFLPFFFFKAPPNFLLQLNYQALRGGQSGPKVIRLEFWFLVTDPRLFSLGLHWSLWKFAILSKKNTIKDAISTCKWKYITVSDPKNNSLEKKKKVFSSWMESKKFLKKCSLTFATSARRTICLRSQLAYVGTPTQPIRRHQW